MGPRFRHNRTEASPWNREKRQHLGNTVEGSGGNTGIGAVHMQGQESPWDTSPKSHDTVGLSQCKAQLLTGLHGSQELSVGSENVIVNGSAQIL